MGHGFYRLVGTRLTSGAWSVALQLTSYYQFRIGINFGVAGIGVTGAEMRYLEQVGLAKNFREIGTGMLTFNADGSPS